jgi:hypothetical protein
MTKAQYYAMQEISANAEHTAVEFLRIRPQTLAALLRNGWVQPLGRGLVWTRKGADAMPA